MLYSVLGMAQNSGTGPETFSHADAFFRRGEVSCNRHAFVSAALLKRMIPPSSQSKIPVLPGTNTSSRFLTERPGATAKMFLENRLSWG
jgi:hypothetical protein